MLNLLFTLTDLVKTLSDTLGIWYLIISNAFGVIAVLSKITELQIKNRKTILLFALFANISWVFYFALQGGLTSAISCLIMTTQVVIFSYRSKYKWANSKVWLVVFSALQILMCALTLNNWYDVLPAIAGIVSVFAYFVFDEDKYRILIFIYIVLWLINSILNMYLVSLISDSLSTLSALIAIIRFNVLKTHKKSKKDIQQTNQ